MPSGRGTERSRGTTGGPGWTPTGGTDGLYSCPTSKYVVIPMSGRFT